MVRITLDIPDWALERHLFFFAGMELFAWKPSGKGEIHAKTKRCVKCGWCCENLRPECAELKQIGQEKICQLAQRRPFLCSYSDPHMTDAAGKENCSIAYEVRQI